MPANLPSHLILAATLAWTPILQLGPYVAGGILLAALLGQLDLPRRWGRWLSHSGPGVVLGAACLGGTSLLCTYGTVPVLVELLRGGASPGPALAFLVASSLLNPQLFVMMAGGLGLRLALAHVAGVLLLSLAALLQTLVPPEWVSSLLGAGRWYGVLLAGVLGVPFYACGGGAVPVIAGLLAQGMSPGAASAFFLAGPATRLTALAALGTLLNRQALVVYVAYVVVGAALVGAALNLVLGG